MAHIPRPSHTEVPALKHTDPDSVQPFTYSSDRNGEQLGNNAGRKLPLPLYLKPV